MTQAAHDLSGVRLKLARAQTHIDAIRAKTAAFIRQTPPPLGVRHERETRPDGVVEYTLYAVVREQPPGDFALLIGDAIHNLRSALDYLVYELAAQTMQRRRKTQSPLGEFSGKLPKRARPSLRRGPFACFSFRLGSG
jgi:hypothetical protein